MTRRKFFEVNSSAVAGVSLARAQNSGASQASQPPKTNTPPNILLIISDQLTPFMTTPYGSQIAKTPNLARLANTGTVFENAYCNSPLCVPSRNSMWSGQLPSAIAAYDNGSELPAHYPTIPYVLRSAGYRTAVTGKCHFIGPDQLHGFDERLSPCIFPAGFNMTPDWTKGPVYNQGTSIQAMFRMLGPSRWGRQLGFDQYAFDRGIERLREHTMRDAKQPLFLTISLTQPHDPFTTTKEFLDLYSASDIPLPPDKGDIRRLSPTYEWFIIHHGLDREKLSPERIREARRNYLGMVSWIDHKVGLLLDEVDRLGMQNDTAIVFISDHGEMLGDHGQWSKRLLLEWSSRIPLIVRIPGMANAGTRINQPVSLLDILPTLADLGHAQVPGSLPGRSVLPMLRGDSQESPAPVIAEYMGEGAIEPMRMLRQGDYKYMIVNGYAPQLFDLKKDPGETVNLAGRPEYKEIEHSLKNKIETGWDGPALKKAVIADQQQRLFLFSMMKTSKRPKWDYVAETPGPYFQ